MHHELLLFGVDVFCRASCAATTAAAACSLRLALRVVPNAVCVSRRRLTWLGKSAPFPLATMFLRPPSYVGAPQVNKGRNGANVQRFLYLSPTNKQVVWATKATSKGKLSKKGLTLEGITELHSEAPGIRVEAVSETAGQQ